MELNKNRNKVTLTEKDDKEIIETLKEMDILWDKYQKEKDAWQDKKDKVRDLVIEKLKTFDISTDEANGFTRMDDGVTLLIKYEDQEDTSEKMLKSLAKLIVG